MARKEITITLDDRGSERKFRIVEMSATRLQSWIIRAGLLLASAIDLDGVDTSGGLDNEAIAKIGQYLISHGIGELSKLDYAKAQPLLDELLECCYRVDGGVSQQCTPNTVDGFIDDVRTLFRLQIEAAKVNFDFFGAGGTSPASPLSPSETDAVVIPRKAHD